MAFGQVQVAEHSEHVWPKLNAGTNLSELGCLLDHRHVMAVPAQGVGDGQAADAAASDENMETLIHVFAGIACPCHIVCRSSVNATTERNEEV